MKSRAEIEELKRNWEGDPCWDIEDTEGFEDHRGELLAHHEKMSAIWGREREERLKMKAAELGMPENLVMAGYVMYLENQIASLSKRLDLLESH